MFLTNRRHRLIYFCLIGMEIAWITPFLLLIYRPFQVWPPFLVFTLFFIGLLVWILAIELSSYFIRQSPHYQLFILGLIGLTSLALIRIFVYADRSPFDLTWPFDMLQSVVQFEQGMSPALVVVLLNFFIWFRASNASSRDIDFWNVGLSFRVGMLLLIFGGGMLYQFSDINALSFLWLFFTFGLSAIALTRIDEKSNDARSMGNLLPLNRLGQLLFMIGLTMMVTIWLSGLYSPSNLRAIFVWTQPVWQLIGGIFLLMLTLLFWLLEPIFIWFSTLIVNAMNSLDLSGLAIAFDAFRDALATGEEQAQSEPFAAFVPAWIWTFLRYVGISVVLLVFLGLIMVFLDRLRRRSLSEEGETEASEDITLGKDSLREGIGWLRNALGLVRRYGVGRQLLAAISVENMYANLCRLAQKQGYPRHPSQPPDDYLPVLTKAFAGQDALLARITAGYMRVHYGNQALSKAEVAQIRADYERIRQTDVEQR